MKLLSSAISTAELLALLLTVGPAFAQQKTYLRRDLGSHGDMRCKSDNQYEVFAAGHGWLTMPMGGGTKCCPGADGKTIMTMLQGAECPGVLSAAATGTGAGTIATETTASTSSAMTGDQRCTTSLDKYEEFYHGTWNTRNTAAGTKCCPHLSGEKRIIQQFLNEECPSNMPSSTPSAAPSSKPSPSPSPSPSCIAGSARVHLPSSSVKRIDELVMGENIQGLDEYKQPATCSIEAIGHFGRGPVHGNYTDDHFVLPSNISEAVSVHGPVGELEETEKYAVLTSCPVGLDEVGAGFTPVDADFFGGDKNDVSWSDYLLIHASILELVRESGSFWFSPETYQSMEQVRRYTGALYRTMLRCAKDHNDCEDFEKASEDLIENSLTENSKNLAKSTFHGLGQHRALGSASAVVSKGRSVRK